MLKADKFRKFLAKSRSFGCFYLSAHLHFFSSPHVCNWISARKSAKGEVVDDMLTTMNFWQFDISQVTQHLNEHGLAASTDEKRRYSNRMIHELLPFVIAEEQVLLPLLLEWSPNRAHKRQKDLNELKELMSEVETEPITDNRYVRSTVEVWWILY